VLADLTVPRPERLAPDEVEVRIARSGVNPSDWKSRRGALHIPIGPGKPQIPHHDGAGTVERVGADVDSSLVGARVWVHEAAYRRLGGTAAEYTVLPLSLTTPLPEHADLDTGAALGIPFMTAHRALTLIEGGPAELAPGALAGRNILVAGGAGAVGNAAIQLARWAGAQVITTVSSPRKAQLAEAAGAHHVLNYRLSPDTAASIRKWASDGVDTVVEVSPVVNAELDAAVLKPSGVVAVYADDGQGPLTLPVRTTMTANTRYQFILVYTMPEDAKRAAVRAVRAALEDRGIGVGEKHGIPVHHYSLSQVRKAHTDLERGLVGRVLIDVTS
jgi:NADPH2:quinone reductase